MGNFYAKLIDSDRSLSGPGSKQVGSLIQFFGSVVAFAGDSLEELLAMRVGAETTELAATLRLLLFCVENMRAT